MLCPLNRVKYLAAVVLQVTWRLGLAFMLGTCPGTLYADTKAGPPAQGRLLIFISLSMPEVSLRRLVEEAGRVDAVLMLRGLHRDSFHATLKRLHDVYDVEIDHDGDTRDSKRAVSRPSVLIDPTAFEQFAVEAVPVFALLLEATARCIDVHCRAPRHLLLAGDVSLHTALERFRSRPVGARYAEAMLASLVGDFTVRR